MNNIKIYTLSWCPHCNALKSFLKENKIEYIDFDVEKNEEIAEDIIKRSGQEGFPIIEIDQKIIIGFNKEKIIEELKK